LFLNAVYCGHSMLVTVYLCAESIFASEIIAVFLAGSRYFPRRLQRRVPVNARKIQFFSVSSLNLSSNLKHISYNVYISSESPA